ncbi:hypothetical protein Apa02nite_050100 [Actinoplanes palleronii]|uniref:Uncharacterized protein n=1 Tax=Actinoplanes palleronii TaxID=113570 RepID=A0ABQ4BDY8_9ACTN|nr:hypothetical protein Apa02nite_050100 [Actinoplanes palleronii]
MATPRPRALLAPAHRRNDDTGTRLAAGSEIGVATAWRPRWEPRPKKSVPGLLDFLDETG